MGVSGGIAAAVIAAAAAENSSEQSRRTAHGQMDQQRQLARQAEATKPQQTQAPGVQGVQSIMDGQGQSGGAPGVAQTFLTGSSGVDPSTLNLGKSTLLGG